MVGHPPSYYPSSSIMEGHRSTEDLYLLLVTSSTKRVALTAHSRLQTLDLQQSRLYRLLAISILSTIHGPSQRKRDNNKKQKRRKAKTRRHPPSTQHHRTATVRKPKVELLYYCIEIINPFLQQLYLNPINKKQKTQPNRIKKRGI